MRPPFPAIPIASTRRWATTFSPPARCCASCTPTPPTRTARTISAATFCLRWSGAPRCTPTIFRPTRFPAIRRTRPPTGAMSEPSMPTTKPTWICASVSPALNLYNREWPLRTAGYPDPPAKFTFDDEDRRGQAIDSIVSGGSILSGGMVRNSVIGRDVRVHSGALVEDSIIFDNCDIGRRAKVRRAILDKNVRVPEDATIGYDLEHDRRCPSRDRKRHRGGGRPPFDGGSRHDRGVVERKHGQSCESLGQSCEGVMYVFRPSSGRGGLPRRRPEPRNHHAGRRSPPRSRSRCTRGTKCR